MTERDRNCTKEEIQDIQQLCTFLCQFCNSQDSEFIERYLDQTRGQVDGTMDVIMPHFMSITDMNKGKHNLKFIRNVMRKILEIKQLAKEFKEAA